jgi:hypothetical protein
MKKYIVHQTFKSLGDPCRTEHTRKQAAEKAARALRMGIAVTVSEMDTPRCFEKQKAGSDSEIRAWEEAAEFIGLDFDGGERTPGSPEKYGLEAGKQIAETAVSIDVEW